MNYKGKRLKANLTPYTVARELGIDYDKYLLIEKGKIALESDLLDKFMKIVEPKNARGIKFNRFQKINDLKKKSKDGKLKEMMTSRGYTGTKLAEAIGVSDSEISRCLRYGKHSKKINEDTLERIYDFLSNPINTYVEKTNVEKVKGKNNLTEEEKAIVNKFMEDNNLSREQLAKKIGYVRSTVDNLFGTNSYCSPKARKKLFDYINKNKTKTIIEEVNEESQEIIIEIPQEVETTEETTIDPIQKEEPQIEEIPKEEKELDYTDVIELVKENQLLKQKVSELEIQLTRYNKLIDRM